MASKEMEDLLRCGLCPEVCKRGVTLECCGAQGCRACATKQITQFRKCWNKSCAIDLITEKLINDTTLRSAAVLVKAGKAIPADLLAKIKERREKVPEVEMMDVTPSSTPASATKPAQAESKIQPKVGPLDARFINKNLSQSAGGPSKQNPANQKPPSANATQSPNQKPPTLQSGSANKTAQSNPDVSNAANVSAANKRKMTSEPSPDSPKKGKSSEPVKVYMDATVAINNKGLRFLMQIAVSNSETGEVLLIPIPPDQSIMFPNTSRSSFDKHLNIKKKPGPNKHWEFLRSDKTTVYCVKSVYQGLLKLKNFFKNIKDSGRKVALVMYANVLYNMVWSEIKRLAYFQEIKDCIEYVLTIENYMKEMGFKPRKNAGKQPGVSECPDITCLRLGQPYTLQGQKMVKDCREGVKLLKTLDEQTKQDVWLKTKMTSLAPESVPVATKGMEGILLIGCSRLNSRPMDWLPVLFKSKSQIVQAFADCPKTPAAAASAATKGGGPPLATPVKQGKPIPTITGRSTNKPATAAAANSSQLPRGTLASVRPALKSAKPPPSKMDAELEEIVLVEEPITSETLYLTAVYPVFTVPVPVKLKNLEEGTRMVKFSEPFVFMKGKGEIKYTSHESKVFWKGSEAYAFFTITPKIFPGSDRFKTCPKKPLMVIPANTSMKEVEPVTKVVEETRPFAKVVKVELVFASDPNLSSAAPTKYTVDGQASTVLVSLRPYNNHIQGGEKALQFNNRDVFLYLKSKLMGLEIISHIFSPERRGNLAKIVMRSSRQVSFNTGDVLGVALLFQEENIPLLFLKGEKSAASMKALEGADDDDIKVVNATITADKSSPSKLSSSQSLQAPGGSQTCTVMGASLLYPNITNQLLIMLDGLKGTLTTADGGKSALANQAKLKLLVNVFKPHKIAGLDTKDSSMTVSVFHVKGQAYAFLPVKFGLGGDDFTGHPLKKGIVVATYRNLQHTPRATSKPASLEMSACVDFSEKNRYIGERPTKLLVYLKFTSSEINKKDVLNQVFAVNTVYHSRLKVLSKVLMPLPKERLAPQKTQTNDMQAELVVAAADGNGFVSLNPREVVAQLVSLGHELEANKESQLSLGLFNVAGVLHEPKVNVDEYHEGENFKPEQPAAYGRGGGGGNNPVADRVNRMKERARQLGAGSGGGRDREFSGGFPPQRRDFPRESPGRGGMNNRDGGGGRYSGQSFSVARDGGNRSFNDEPQGVNRSLEGMNTSYEEERRMAGPVGNQAMRPRELSAAERESQLNMKLVQDRGMGGFVDSWEEGEAVPGVDDFGRGAATAVAPNDFRSSEDQFGIMSSTGAGGFAPMMTAGGSARYDPAEALEDQRDDRDPFLERQAPGGPYSRRQEARDPYPMRQEQIDPIQQRRQEPSDVLIQRHEQGSDPFLQQRHQPLSSGNIQRSDPFLERQAPMNPYNDRQEQRDLFLRRQEPRDPFLERQDQQRGGSSFGDDHHEPRDPFLQRREEPRSEFSDQRDPFLQRREEPRSEFSDQRDPFLRRQQNSPDDSMQQRTDPFLDMRRRRENVASDPYPPQQQRQELRNPFVQRQEPIVRRSVHEILADHEQDIPRIGGALRGGGGRPAEPDSGRTVFQSAREKLFRN